MNWALLQNSLVVSGLATVLAMLFGFVAALSVVGLPSGWRVAGLVAGVATLALPPFVVSNCWLALLGHVGLLHRWLPLNIYSLPGTVWVLALMLWPLTLFAAVGAWQRIEASQLEAEPALRGLALLRELLWPVAAPALAQAAVVTFVLALNDFAVPALLQVRVFPAELWVEFNTNFNYGAALLAGLPLVAAPLLLLWWLRRKEIAWPRRTGAAPAALFRQQLGRGWSGLATLAFGGVVVLALVLPIAELLGTTRSWTELPVAMATSWTPTVTSAFLAVVTATVTVAIGLATWRARWGGWLWVLFFTPGVLLGVVLIFLLDRPALDWFYESFSVVILALVIRYVAIGWHGARLARQSVDPELTDAARLEGASAEQLFWHVHRPQMAPVLAGAWYVVYLLCLWDVETLVLIVPPGGETLALRVFNLLHYGHNAQVNALCLMLLVLAVLPLLLWWGGRLLMTCRAAQRVVPPVSKPAVPPTSKSARSGGGGSFVLDGSTQVGKPAIRQTWKSAPRSSSSSRPDLGRRRFALIVTTVASVMTLCGCGVGSGSAGGHREAELSSRLFSRVIVIGHRGTAPGEFSKPRSVAVDRHGNLYVADVTGRIQKFSSNGTYLLQWQLGPSSLRGEPKGLSMDRNGDLISVQPHYPRINVFTPDGKLIRRWGRVGTNVGEFRFPRAAVVNSQGNVWVSEFGAIDRIQLFTPDGAKVLRVIGTFGDGPGQFNRAEGLYVDRHDRLYVADACNHRIQVFDGQGHWLRSYGKPGEAPGEFSYPYDVCVDTAGYQFVSGYANNRVQVFDAHDHLVEVLGHAGRAPGEFNNPWSLALDAAGDLYVADSNNNRVQKFIRRHPLSPPAPVSTAANAGRDGSPTRPRAEHGFSRSEKSSKHPKASSGPPHTGGDALSRRPSSGFMTAMRDVAIAEPSRVPPVR